jgi:hypothetical protein
MSTFLDPPGSDRGGFLISRRNTLPSSVPGAEITSWIALN